MQFWADGLHGVLLKTRSARVTTPSNICEEVPGTMSNLAISIQLGRGGRLQKSGLSMIVIISNIAKMAGDDRSRNPPCIYQVLRQGGILSPPSARKRHPRTQPSLGVHASDKRATLSNDDDGKGFSARAPRPAARKHDTTRVAKSPRSSAWRAVAE